MPSISDFIILLKSGLSESAAVFTDSEQQEFKDLIVRWNDIDLKEPGAIVLVGTEEDVVLSVKLAVEHEIPFVCKSGGHSTWSTIGEEGFILDLSQLKKICVDKENQHITIQSGVLVKQANDAAWKEGLCVPLGNANTAGIIPMAIGGGMSIISSICGFVCDNIISARFVSAEGELIVVDSFTNSDLFYAIRGAGQHFGVVTELTLQAYPLSILGTTDGSVWTGSMIFPAVKAEAVFRALVKLTQDTSAPAAYACVIAAPPPQFTTFIVIMPIFFGATTDAERFYQPLLLLEPIAGECKSTPYVRVNDVSEGFNKKGGFKQWAGRNIQTFNPVTWMKVLECFEELKAKCPDATCNGGGFSVMCNGHVPVKKLNVTEVAFSHRDIKMWAEALSWYTDQSSRHDVLLYEKKMLDIVRQDQHPNIDAAYQNWSREPPVEVRYGGTERLKKLKDLKQEWDPKGIFTQEFM